MNIFEYLRHTNGENAENDNDCSINDDKEDKFDNLEELIGDNKEIKYKKL